MEAAIKHARGVLPCVLPGPDRRRAHAAIINAFGDSHGGELAVFDERVAELARLDPSLFIEPIPALQNAPKARFRGWDHMRGQYGNWVSCAAERGWGKTVGAVLDAGVHPDDFETFHRAPLLDRHRWRDDPQLLRLALDAGASPDLPETPYDLAIGRSAIRAVLGEVVCRSEKAFLDSGRQPFLDIVQCAHMLLDAGAKVLDLPTDGCSPARSRRNAAMETAISLLMRDQWRAGLVSESMEGLVRKLEQCGASLDRPCGLGPRPPVIRAIRSRNMTGVQLLIELGARTDDAHIVQPGSMLDGVTTLLGEAEIAGGQEFVALVNEALLKRRLTQLKHGTPEDAVISAPGSRRRRPASV